MSCRAHGVTVAAVPWARHQAGHTHHFDAQVAWLATQTSKTAVTQLIRIAWRTVGAIITRVWDDTEKLYDPFADLRRIGIDEISYKRGHKYLTVVVDHDSGRLVWAAPIQDMATLASFFDALGPQRSALITHVSADGAPWINTVVAKRCPNAVRCADPFHVVKWVTDALDQVRRDAWNDTRKAARQNEARRGLGRPAADAPPRPDSARATGLKNSRYDLWKNPENLTDKQHVKLAWVVQTNPTLGRAYYLKEGLRVIFKLPLNEATEALDKWVGWARRCRIPAFVKLQRSIVKHRTAILASIEHGLSNGRIESINTRIRLITRIAFGFKSSDALIALASSASAATNQYSQAGLNPRKSQESRQIATNIKIYFCDPRSPWQRGSNENTNGLLRQYLPRNSNLYDHSQTELDTIADELNTRPRKTLGYHTPVAILNEALH